MPGGDLRDLLAAVRARVSGVGHPTTRKMRGLTRSVIALMVPPLPAPSRPSKTTQILRPLLALSSSHHLVRVFGPIVHDPLLQLHQLDVQAVIGQACNRFLGWCEDRGLTLTAIGRMTSRPISTNCRRRCRLSGRSDCLHHLQRQRCDPLGKETRDDVASCASFCVREARYARGIH
jgi:hypothetical protein